MTNTRDVKITPTITASTATASTATTNTATTMTATKNAKAKIAATSEHVAETMTLLTENQCHIIAGGFSGSSYSVPQPDSPELDGSQLDDSTKLSGDMRGRH
ncbi:hypothetical protein E2K93_01065 [Thalassotalea sp. HSM 43]|uniref:hypothetical protein n=1 Tax=Thalassotalea sp. HSM 43 TaxID=2552945 RepID=UPI001081DBB0|nr:hypothetical protein [Thalassotalea sp. HSM 43]QBY03043.1 hypothetical protein E2K93_01065 [Thalassotalea sp. HSM 43]